MVSVVLGLRSWTSRTKSAQKIKPVLERWMGLAEERAIQERPAEPDGIHRTRAVKETQASHVIHAPGTRTTQQTL